jgi:pyruvate/2-oxoglutarate dehydrogenase complex dihydrolipoamide acyltransferase (E2) component
MNFMSEEEAQVQEPEAHEQQPADETIAAGEHMDLDAQAEALEMERRAGVLSPTGYIGPSSSPNPYVSEEMQGMDLTPKTVGPPQYGSPDPASAAGKLMALEDGHPFEGLPDEHAVAISEDYAAQYEDAVPGTAGDEAASEIDATDEAKSLADEHGIDLSSVEGSGKDGRITKRDVEDAVEEAEASDN